MDKSSSCIVCRVCNVYTTALSTLSYTSNISHIQCILLWCCDLQWTVLKMDWIHGGVVIA